MNDKFENLNDIEKAESWLGEARGPDTALVYAMIANAKAAERSAAAAEAYNEIEREKLEVLKQIKGHMTGLEIDQRTATHALEQIAAVLENATDKYPGSQKRHLNIEQP